MTYKIQTFLGEPTWRPKLNISISDIHNSNATFIQEVQKSQTTDENSNEVSDKARSGASSGIVPEFLANLDLMKYFVRRNQEQESCKVEDWDDYKARLLMNPRNNLYQAVVYLAPGDYHRFHSPINWKVNFRRHFQGKVLSSIFTRCLPDLFSETLLNVGLFLVSTKHLKSAFYLHCRQYMMFMSVKSYAMSSFQESLNHFSKTAFELLVQYFFIKW